MLQKVFDPIEWGLPSDLDSEKIILGSAILKGENMATLRDVLFADDFSLESHRRIWVTLVAMHDAGENIDRITVLSALSDRKELEAAGGISYVTDLDNGLPFIAHLESYVENIRRKSAKRRAILQCNNYMLRLATTNEDASEIFSEASARMMELNGELMGDTGFSTPADVIMAAGGLGKYLDGRRADGIKTPWPGLNRMTGGFRKEELIILAAHTARGKTAMALNVALHAASRQDVAVAIFSMEMSRELLTDRFIAINGKFDGRSLRRPERDMYLEAERVRDVGNSARKIAELPIYMCDNTTSTVPAMEGKLRRLMARVPIALVIVDYIQLASGVGRTGNRAEEVGSISRGLKRMAAALKVPVIALSQFNRDSARDSREPEKYDLKESGSIEQDASLILAIHFTRMYDVAAQVFTGDVKLKVLKQRNGPEGWLPFTFHAQSGVFEEIDQTGISE